MKINSDLLDLIYINKKGLKKISDIYEFNYYQSNFIKGYSSYFGKMTKLIECTPLLYELENYLNENVILNISILHTNIKSDKFKARTLESLLNNLFQLDEYIYQTLNIFFDLKLAMMNDSKKRWTQDLDDYNNNKLKSENVILKENYEKLNKNDIKIVNRQNVIKILKSKYYLDDYSEDIIDLLNSRNKQLQFIRNKITHGQSLQFNSKIAPINLYQGHTVITTSNSLYLGEENNILSGIDEIDLDGILKLINEDIELSKKIIDMIKTGILNNVCLEERKNNFKKIFYKCEKCNGVHISMVPQKYCIFCLKEDSLILVNFGYFYNFPSSIQDFINREMSIVLSNEVFLKRYIDIKIKTKLGNFLFEKYYEEGKKYYDY
jgi:hypothetical protein